MEDSWMVDEFRVMRDGWRYVVQRRCIFHGKPTRWASLSRWGDSPRVWPGVSVARYYTPWGAWLVKWRTEVARRASRAAAFMSSEESKRRLAASTVDKWHDERA